MRWYFFHTWLQDKATRLREDVTGNELKWRTQNSLRTNVDHRMPCNKYVVGVLRSDNKVVTPLVHVHEVCMNLMTVAIDTHRGYWKKLKIIVEEGIELWTNVMIKRVIIAETLMVFTVLMLLWSVVGGRRRLHLVDLGSCSRSRDGSSLSLTSLGAVITSLLSGQRQVPYRSVNDVINHRLVMKFCVIAV